MNSALLQSATVSLRPIERTDLPLMYRLENDSATWDSAATPQPMSRSTIERFISSATGDIYTDRQLRLVIERADTRTAIGFVDLTDFSPRHLRAEVGIIVLPEHRRQGFGSEALRIVEQYATKALLVHQLYAYVSPSNERSVRLFAGRGYKQAGTLRDWLQTNEGFQPILLLQKVF